MNCEYRLATWTSGWIGGAFWQEIVVHLLQGYLERFYAFHKREFEAP